MSTDIQGTINKWKEFTEQYFTSYYSRKLSVYSDLQKELSGINRKNLSEEKEAYAKAIKAIHSQLNESTIEDVLSEYLAENKNFKKQIPPYIVQYQDDLCIYGPPQLLKSRFLKPFKRSFFHIANIPVSVRNLFTKNKKPKKRWKHKVRTRSLFDQHYVRPLIYLTIELEKKLVRQELAFSENLKDKGDNNVDFIKEMNDWWQTSLTNLYKKKDECFIEDLIYAGTIDYPNRKLVPTQQKKRTDKSYYHWAKSFQQHNNQLFAFYEDWRSDLELEGLASFANEKWQQRKQEFNNWINNEINEGFEAVGEFVKSQKEVLTGVDKENKKLLTQLKYEVSKKLTRKLLPNISTLLSKNSLLNQLDQFEFLLEQKIEQLHNKYHVVKDGDYQKPLASGDFVSISNKELLDFEMSHVFGAELNKIKNQFVTLTNHTIEKVMDLDEIIQYTISSIEAEQDRESESKEKPIDILTGGYERAQKTLSETLENLIKKTDQLIIEIDDDINHFTKQVLKLTENESLLELRYQITKAKTLERSSQVKEIIKERLISIWAKFSQWGKRIFERIIKYYERVQKYIVADKKTDAKARDLSDFIFQSRQKIKNLPLLYQRLYSIEPLQDDFLFEGRNQELNKISTAYQTWKEGKYSSVTLYGEKWSGLTSTINLIPDKIKFSHPVYKFKIKQKITTNESLLSFLNTTFELKTKSIEELISQVNESNSKVVLLEDLQHVFIKKIGGFEQITTLLKFISETQKTIFWITTISIYAYQYLESILSFSGYFSYPIRLEELEDEEIKAIIEKRNRIGGYQIFYEPSQVNQKEKKFNKLSKEKQQIFLSKKYYADLTEFSSSNISLALIFWLLSTRKIENHTVHIDSFDKPDFAFLLHMPKINTFLLHSLILHDGLSSKEMAEILNMSVANVEMILLQMIEDGIIEKTENKYLVNTLVFRSIVQLLKAKNLIY